jgi:GT2 family glycosyltransferase
MENLVYPIYPIEGKYTHNSRFDVSVIIPLYKSNVVIADQIQKWHFDDKYSIELVYVDDLCPSKSKSVVVAEWNKRSDKHDHSIKLVPSVKNKGFAGACNMGAMNSTGDYLIFLNADTVVTPNWITPMIDLFQDPKVGIVGNLQIKEGGKFDGTIDSAGSEWSWHFMNFMHIGRHFMHGSPLQVPMTPKEVPEDMMSVGEREMVTGCCFAIPRHLYNEVGGFDENYKIGYWEDADLNLKVRSMGYKVMFQPKSVIYHKLSHSNISVHQFHESNKVYFMNNWIISGKLEKLVKSPKPADIMITTDSVDRVYNQNMSYYRETYKNSPRWDGIESLNGKTVLVYGEQGLGDNIQFVRYINELKKKGCRVIVHCSMALHALFLGIDGVDEVLDKNHDELPPHHCHILSMSLPFLLNDPKTKFPYVKIKEKMDLGEGFKIGIAWEGSPLHSNNEQRSCHIKYFKPLLDLGAKLFMLQQQIHSPALVCDMDLYGVQLNDFTDTAKLINSVDLVACVDTSVLHLAGAMNKKAIGLLSMPGDYRWNVKEWYPSIKFIRQKETGVWDSVFEELISEVKGLMNENLSA